MARSLIRKSPAYSIPGDLVDFILLGPADDRRQLQDSPILGDVWLAYAADPSGVEDLLITPHKTTTAGYVARKIAEQLPTSPGPPETRSNVAYLQGLVAARLSLDQMLRLIVPMTQWWDERKVLQELEKGFDRTLLQRRIKALFASALASYGKPVIPIPTHADTHDSLSALERYVVLAGLLLWASTAKPPARFKGDKVPVEVLLTAASDHAEKIVEVLLKLYEDLGKTDAANTRRRLIFQVSLNRRVLPALERSVPAVKADAARTLFTVDCRRITWAVLDTGIDGSHPAFTDGDGASRVRKTFDFTRLRELLSSDSDQLTKDPLRLAELLRGTAFDRERQATTRERKRAAQEALDRLAALRQNAEEERPINWDVVEELLLLEQPSDPVSFHGTHVAGIIGASQPPPDVEGFRGMCPEIQLWDFRVLAKNIQDTEFAIIAALQYIRYVNERHSYVTIHGANLSLSIPHNVRNFACGRTPVCNECERLVESGVVVVAAAGNRGYQSFETKEGVFENYAAFSITDPGNAEEVITVGATHGNWPHTYGVSFFSSRGPTGDGRMKPDLVAPGERVKAPMPGGVYGAESGTSMAAPHVSGAAAMLMARYAELIGNPRRIKRLLCDSATDLGRERSFQGHGMLDVLRAFQSI